MPDETPLPSVNTPQELEAQLNAQELTLANEVQGVGVVQSGQPPQQTNIALTEVNIDAHKLARLRVRPVPATALTDAEAFTTFVAPLVADADPIDRAMVRMGAQLEEVLLLRQIPAAVAPVAGVALSWDSVAAREAWSAELRGAVAAKQADLEKGNPEQFIAGYGALAAEMKVKFWAELIVAMAKYESAWKPTTRFKEPAPLNVFSIGLLQLSYEDAAHYPLEPLNPAAKSLEDPLVNLRCAVVILAQLLAKDRVVVGQSGGSHRGGAAYWSVLRPGASHKLAEIKTLTKRYVGL
jgi:hypothetical protein